MNNTQKYNQAFIENFSINESKLTDDLIYNSIPEWDSVGHMGLVAALEEQFDIMMEMDDIILKNYGNVKLISITYQSKKTGHWEN